MFKLLFLKVLACYILYISSASPPPPSRMMMNRNEPWRENMQMIGNHWSNSGGGPPMGPPSQGMNHRQGHWMRNGGEPWRNHPPPSHMMVNKGEISPPPGWRKPVATHNQMDWNKGGSEIWSGGIKEPSHMMHEGKEPNNEMTVRYEEADLNDNNKDKHKDKAMTENPVKPSHLFTWNSNDPSFYEKKANPFKMKQTTMKDLPPTVAWSSTRRPQLFRPQTIDDYAN